MIQTVDDMIAKYGDQAYHRAVEFTVISVNVNDHEGAAHFVEIAKELMQRGYHKHPKESEPSDPE